MAKHAIVAIDVDLGRLHAWSNRDGRLAYDAAEFPFAALQTHDLVLVEVASPVDTSANAAQAYNRAKWSVGNALQVGRLWYWAQQNRVTLLASSADQWTLKHSEKMRNTVAGTAGEDNHDIRSCREMIFYFGTNPEKWKPIEAYYASLSTKKARHGSHR